MKKNQHLGYSARKWLKRTGVQFFILGILYCVNIVPTYGATFNSTQHLTLNMQDQSLIEIFDYLQEKTNFRFLFSSEDINTLPKVSINVKDADLSTVLAACLKGTNLIFEIKEDMVVLKRTQQQNGQGAEKITIEGVVKDKTGATLPGVSVIIKGTSLGITTDINGYYKLTVPKLQNLTLVYSFIGMNTKEVIYKNESNINIVLEENKQELEEVVITGYFTQSKGSFTGAASTFTREELLQAGNNNILSSLQNIDPTFLQIENNIDGSNPNVIPDFEIRGSSSIPNLDNSYNGNPNMPIFIMDGFEVDAQTVFDMDQNRVENITILKDASATAVYGSRASNGVVVIQTRTPEKGKLSLTYSGDAIFSIADLSAYDLLNASEKLKLEKNAGFYDVSETTMERAELILDIYNKRLQAVKKGVDTYWLKQPLETVAVGHKHSLLIEGGDRSLRYSLNVGYNSSPGQMKKSGRERISIGTNLQYNYHKFLFRNNLTYTDVKGENSPYGSFQRYAELNPYLSPKDSDGKLNYVLEPYNIINGGTIYNPLYNSLLNVTDNTKYSELANNFSIDWTPIDGLNLKGSFAITKQLNSDDQFKPAAHTDFANSAFERKGKYTAARGEKLSYTTNIIGSYFKTLDKNVVMINAGMNIAENRSEVFTAIAEGFPNQNMDHISFGSMYEKNGKPKGSEQTTRLIGFLGNLNYNYDQRYFADLSFRFDASSMFGTDKRWAPFWSSGIGWNIHNEDLFKNHISAINNLRLKLSYGETGNINFNPYQAMAMYEYLVSDRYEFSVPAQVMGLENPRLGWQKTAQTNLGLDIDLFKSRIILKGNYYVKISKDVLTTVSLAPSTGFNTYLDNLGEVENKGYEVSLRLGLIENKNKKIFWTVNGSAIRNENKLKKMSNALRGFNETQDNNTAQTPVVRLIEGKSMNSIWVNQSLGIDPATGKELFITPSGNITNQWNAANYVIGGCSDPKVRGNIGTNFTWQGLQFNATLRYSCGKDVYNTTLIQRVQDVDIRKNVDRRVYEDRWMNPGDEVRFTGYEGGFNLRSSTKPTSRFIQKENYIELATINMSYTFNQQLIKNCGLKFLRLSFYMNDVFRASSVKQERGINYPFARNFTVGLQAKF